MARRKGSRHRLEAALAKEGKRGRKARGLNIKDMQEGFPRSGQFVYARRQFLQRNAGRPQMMAGGECSLGTSIKEVGVLHRLKLRHL
jgi:hypothetical protein